MRFWSIFDQFSIPPMAKNMQKPFVFVGQNKDACFYVMIALETDRPKTVRKRFQDGPKSMLAARSLPKPILDRFWTDLGPFWGRFRSDFRLVFDRFLVEAPQLALYAYMLVCIYAIMQKCMHTLMKCTTSLGHGDRSMQKGGGAGDSPRGRLR